MYMYTLQYRRHIWEDSEWHGWGGAIITSSYEEILKAKKEADFDDVTARHRIIKFEVVDEPVLNKKKTERILTL